MLSIAEIPLGMQKGLMLLKCTIHNRNTTTYLLFNSGGVLVLTPSQLSIPTHIVPWTQTATILGFARLRVQERQASHLPVLLTVAGRALELTLRASWLLTAAAVSSLL